MGVLTIFALFGLDILNIFDPVNCSNIERKISEELSDFKKWVADGNDPYTYDPLKFAHVAELIGNQKRCIIQANR